MQASVLWALAVTHTVYCLVLQVHPYSSCDMPGNFPNFILQPFTACSWQHLAFIVVKYHFTQSAQGHNGALVTTRRRVLNTMHKIIVNQYPNRVPQERKVFPLVQVHAQRCHLPAPSPSTKLPKSQPVPHSLGAEKAFPPLGRKLKLADGGISNSASNRSFENSPFLALEVNLK